MGVGIAVRFALAGHATTVVETNAGRAGGVAAIAAGILDELAEAGLVDGPQRQAALGRLAVSGALADVAAADAVIEAIPEVLEAKHALYAKLEPLLAPGAVIASNTSGFAPDVLSAGLRLPERFLIGHFWNPPHAIPLVEVVPGSATDPAVAQRFAALLTQAGAEAVVLKAAIPGFIGNRLQFAVLREALHIVRSGVATADEVDRVMKASLGRRYGLMGPLEVADLGGLGTFLSIASHLMPDLARDQEPLELLRELVEKGRLGAATGQGFYTWDDARREHLKDVRRQQLAALR